jgi:tRNA (cytidine/uridine-2'-O-)-methyltransferase
LAEAGKDAAVLHVVLMTPEIPHNTGAAGRLCLATGARLHLIKPLGFSLDDRQVKRVGLDYWKDVDLQVWEDWEEFSASIEEDAGVYFLTTKTKRPHWDVEFVDGDYLVFGCETKGLPESMLAEHSEGCLTIPMKEGSTRSLNLSTSVGIVLYEAVRQVGL